MSDCAVTILSSENEYKPSLRNSILSAFQAIESEIHTIIDFFGHSKNDYVIKIYPLTIERVDGKPVSDVMLECIRVRLSGKKKAA